jgi:hypothetical protein
MVYQVCSPEDYNNNYNEEYEKRLEGDETRTNKLNLGWRIGLLDDGWHQEEGSCRV